MSFFLVVARRAGVIFVPDPAMSPTIKFTIVLFLSFFPSWIPSTFSFSACQVQVNSLSVITMVLSSLVATLARAARILFISAGSSF